MILLARIARQCWNEMTCLWSCCVLDCHECAPPRRFIARLRRRAHQVPVQWLYCHQRLVTAHQASFIQRIKEGWPCKAAAGHCTHDAMRECCLKRNTRIIIKTGTKIQTHKERRRIKNQSEGSGFGERARQPMCTRRTCTDRHGGCNERT
jgi:hypothetical protein